MVGDRFCDPFWKISDKVRTCWKNCLKFGLENMELDGFWVVVAPFGLGLAVVRGTGPKFHYRPLFGHMGPPGAQNRPFWGFWGHFGFLASPWPIVAYCPLGSAAWAEPYDILPGGTTVEVRPFTKSVTMTTRPQRPTAESNEAKLRSGALGQGP